jgi:hypothetical protein
MLVKYINKKPLTIMLVTNDEQNNPTDKYVQLIENVKSKFPENYYKIVKCGDGEKKLKCDKILGLEQTLKLSSIPTLFVINGSNIIEIPVDKIDNVETISNILK